MNGSKPEFEVPGRLVIQSVEVMTGMDFHRKCWVLLLTVPGWTSVTDVTVTATGTFKQTLVLFRPFYPFLAVFSYGGERIISSPRDSPVILIWKATTGTPIRGPVSFGNGPTSIRLSHDGMRLFACPGGVQSEVVTMWDIESGLATCLKLGSYDSHALAFSHDGNKVFTHSDQPRVRDLVTGNIITSDAAHKGGAHLASFSSNGDQIISVGATDGRVIIWDTDFAEKTLKVTANHDLKHSGVIESLAYSHNTSRFVLGLSDGKILLMDSAMGNLVSCFPRHRDRVSSVAFSPDGQLIVSCSFDRRIWVWNTLTGLPFAGPLEGHMDNVRTVLFSPDGKKILSTSDDGSVRVWTLQ